MVSETITLISTVTQRTVLILVLLEDGLGVRNNLPIKRIVKVLILVLLEDGLGDYSFADTTLEAQNVLILVLLEDGLGDYVVVDIEQDVFMQS